MGASTGTEARKYQQSPCENMVCDYVQCRRCSLAGLYGGGGLLLLALNKHITLGQKSQPVDSVPTLIDFFRTTSAANSGGDRVQSGDSRAQSS